MAATAVPHLCNDAGVEKVSVGVKELQCMGAKPPMDHPHVYLDMGAEDQILCPYCSTLFVYDNELGPEESVPPACIYIDQPETNTSETGQIAPGRTQNEPA